MVLRLGKDRNLIYTGKTVVQENLFLDAYYVETQRVDSLLIGRVSVETGFQEIRLTGHVCQRGQEVTDTQTALCNVTRLDAIEY